jgi:GxxExxY protein
MSLQRELTERIIGLAIEVHRETGPGPLESVYEQCLCQQRRNAGILYQRQVAVHVSCKWRRLEDGFRADVLVAETVILEIKALAAIHPPREAQLQTCLRMSHIHIGLLLNFHALRLYDGLRRFIA